MRGGALLVATLLLSGCAGVPPDDRLPDKAPYLLADRFPELTVRVYHVEGWAPSQFALDGLQDEVLRATGRTHLTLVPSTSLGSLSAGDDDEWGATELQSLIARIEPEDETEIAVAFLDGGIQRSNDAQPWGTALGTMALVFVERFADYPVVTLNGESPVPRVNRAEIERLVAIHEVGHVLGLVDNGVPRTQGPVSQDECECHSGDPDSVMYYAADGDQNPAFLAGQESDSVNHRFTADDIADIRAFQRTYGFRP